MNSQLSFVFHGNLGKENHCRDLPFQMYEEFKIFIEDYPRKLVVIYGWTDLVMPLKCPKLIVFEILSMVNIRHN